MPDAKLLGARLRELREERGLSLREVSFPGCSFSFLSRVEAGERVPSPPVLATLARRLDTTYEALVGRSAEGRVSDSELSAAEVAARLGEDGAREQLERVLELARSLNDPHAESRALEALGLLVLDAREDARAVELLEAARHACPSPHAIRERPAIFRALGRAYAGTGDLIHAIAVLRAAFDEVRHVPVDVGLMVQFGTYLANAYTDHGRFGEAENVLAEILRHDEDIAGANRIRLEWALARTYAEQGSLEIAHTYTRRVLHRMELGEELRARGHGHLLMAGVLLDQERAGEAERHLDEAERLLAGESPVELSLLSYERGRAAIAAEDWDGARAHARQMLDRTSATEPGYAGMAYGLLAEVELAGGNLDDARFLCERAVEHMTGTTTPHYISRAYETLSRVEEAAGNLEAALAALRKRPRVREQFS